MIDPSVCLDLIGNRVAQGIASWLDDPDDEQPAPPAYRIFAARWLGVVGEFGTPHKDLLHRVARDDPEADVREAARPALAN